jgi:thiamine-phosphate pyrophosphorylase
VVITDWALPELLARLEAALAGGAGQVAVQHRHPGASDRRFHEEGQALQRLIAGRPVPLFVNRRLDVALALGAHLHLPAHGLPLAAVRSRLPHHLVSVAVHGPGEAQAGADLALVSPVYTPFSKPADTRTPLGLEGFLALRRALECPAFALGGIGPERKEALASADGAAVMSSVLRAADPGQAVRQLLEGLGRRTAPS